MRERAIHCIVRRMISMCAGEVVLWRLHLGVLGSDLELLGCGLHLRQGLTLLLRVLGGVELLGSDLELLRRRLHL